MLPVRWLRRLSLFCAEVSGWLVVPMMLSIFLDALLRSLFNVALIGIVESNSLLLVALVYLGIAGAQASGGNFRLTLLTGRVGGQCLNPLDESRIAGGSSGGSAAA